MIASGLLYFRRCCALRLEGVIQVGTIPTCVSSEGRMMPCCTIFSRLPMSACASSRHAPCVPCGSLLESFAQQRCACYQSFYL